MNSNIKLDSKVPVMLSICAIVFLTSSVVIVGESLSFGRGGSGRSSTSHSSTPPPRDYSSPSHPEDLFGNLPRHETPPGPAPDRDFREILKGSEGSKPREGGEPSSKVRSQKTIEHHNEKTASQLYKELLLENTKMGGRNDVLPRSMQSSLNGS